MLSVKNVFILVILTFFLLSCSDSGDPLKSEIKGWSVQKLYNAASDALTKDNYDRAIKLYQALEATYPYGIYAQQGMLDLAYAYYENSQPELAIPTIDQFMGIYPTNSNMNYALYLKGYINYKNDNGLLSRFTGQDMSERDPKALLEAYQSFQQLIAKYPKSRFAPDARDKMNRLITALAKGELYRARYYMSVKAYLAAISRSQNLITNYPNTPFVEEALAMQVEAYQQLGQPYLAQETKKVLALNFPKSEYLTTPWAYQDISWYAIWR